MKKQILIISSIMISSLFHSQSIEERKEIISKSNQIENRKQLLILKEEDIQRKIRLNNYLQQHSNINKKEKFGEYGLQELMDVLPNGEKIYARTYNEGAARTARADKLYNGGSLGINIQGQNMTAALWDGGNVLSTHQEFMVNGTSKVINMDGANPESHPTHVAGTIVAQGTNSLLRGVAFNASILSYDWTDDITEMTSQASQGLLTSNHSYGIGQLSQLWFYGAYDSRARQIDGLCYNNPYYLPVFSAGNDRNETQAPGSTQIGTKGGYDMIFGHGNAKNIITVAAVNQVSNYIDNTSVVMSSFSSYGPSDDGRIKPDISMKGVNVRSTLPTSNTAQGFMSGTSMASPGITGVVILLQQYHNQLYNNYLRAATVKGLILHNADEAGPSLGPDYEYGWGLVNAEKAAITIRDKNSVTSSKSIIEELSLSNGTTYTKTIIANSTNPLKISISWTDPASTNHNSGSIDPSTKYLVNDLDIKVVKDNITYYPWKLQGMSSPSSPATRNSTNDTDNFERVDISNPSGVYTITVTHKGTLTGGSQNFSLIATSDNLSTLSTNEIIKANDSKVNFHPNPAKDYIKINEEDNGLLVNIFDVSGKLTLTSKLENNRINISQLIKGNYIASFIDKEGTIKSFKFIKE